MNIIVLHMYTHMYTYMYTYELWTSLCCIVYTYVYTYIYILIMKIIVLYIRSTYVRSWRRSDWKITKIYLDFQIHPIFGYIFRATRTPSTHLKTCYKFWGLTWKHFWYVWALPWKLVGNFGSRNCFKSDLLRRQYKKSCGPYFAAYAYISICVHTIVLCTYVYIYTYVHIHVYIIVQRVLRPVFWWIFIHIYVHNFAANETIYM